MRKKIDFGADDSLDLSSNGNPILAFPEDTVSTSIQQSPQIGPIQRRKSQNFSLEKQIVMRNFMKRNSLSRPEEAKISQDLIIDHIDATNDSVMYSPMTRPDEVPARLKLNQNSSGDASPSQRNGSDSIVNEKLQEFGNPPMILQGVRDKEKKEEFVVKFASSESPYTKTEQQKKKLVYRELALFAWVKEFFPCIKHKDKVKYQKGRDRIKQELDVLRIVSKIREFDKLKTLLLDDEQRVLFDNLPQPNLNEPLDPQNALEKQG